MRTKKKGKNAYLQIQKGRENPHALWVYLRLFVGCSFEEVRWFCFAVYFFFRVVHRGVLCEHVFSANTFLFVWLFSHQCDAWSFSSTNEWNDEHPRMSETNPVPLFTVCYMYLCELYFFSSFQVFAWLFFHHCVSSECKYRFEEKANKRLNSMNTRNKRETWNQNNSGKQISQSCLSIDIKLNDSNL